jgi:hypothetical protein
MSLDERMEQARSDYRALEVPDRAVVAIDLDRRPIPGVARRGRWMLAAAALVIVMGATVAVATADDDPATEVAEGTTSTAEGNPTTTEPPSPVVPVPEGPYVDAERVTVAHPPGLGEEVRVVQCAEVAAVETCGLTIGDPAAVPRDGATTLEVRRLMLTPEGLVDCADVACRLVAYDEEGGQLPSARLRFEGNGFDAPMLAMAPAAEPGTFILHPGGLTPHGSWTENRGTLADDVRPFDVRLCAFGPAEPTPGPFGEDLWDQQPVAAGEATCRSEALDVSIDPDDPDAEITVALPTGSTGYGGWFDCRTGRCFVEINRTVVTDPGGSGWTERATAALVPADGEWPDPVRPTLTLLTPGPHRPGQVVTVTIAGLHDGAVTTVGICEVASPWSCGAAEGGRELGNGTHQVLLPEGALDSCGPEDCYLELDSGSEGLAPLATAPLDTPG